jgi:diguanylate cyclase (GGDEF)-like protein/PAS domain S-box-containing protein
MIVAGGKEMADKKNNVCSSQTFLGYTSESDSDMDFFTSSCINQDQRIEKSDLFDKALIESNERLETLLFMLPVGVVLIDYDTRVIIEMNPYATMILGYPKEQVIGQKCFNCICPINIKSCPIKNPDMEIDRSEGELICASGERIPVFKSAITMKFDGKPVILQCFQDISEIKKLQNQLTKMARTDYLTGLFNRMFFYKRAKEELSRANRNQKQFSLLMLDIDYFKKINDKFGHPAGDAVLQRISHVCQNGLRESDVIGRLGGEEFGVLLTECQLHDAEIAAERLRQMVASETVKYEEEDINCTISIGISSWTEDTLTVDSLIKMADDALYRAKNSGRNRICLYI